jgi:catechol 2,3-dioxygenase-like lactoylglutathione lyase family enzyme
VLDHVSIPVSDLGRSQSFYDAVLEPLGACRRIERPGALGYGTGPVPGFWLLEREPGGAKPGPGLHVCFCAASAEEVHAFYQAGLALGAKDAGAPGLRPEYSAGFYGAFLIDPDGYKVEATWRSALSPR